MNDLQSRIVDGTHLTRKSQDVKYLHISNGKTGKTQIQEHIFEAQLSLVVIGVDNRFWTAYSVVDVYFKTPNCSETAEYYHQANEDPHSGGKDGADQIIWDAREFFLRILACRMEQVREEWNNVVSQLLHNIEPYVFLPVLTLALLLINSRQIKYSLAVQTPPAHAKMT